MTISSWQIILKKHLVLALVILVFLLGFFLRVYKLNEFPVGFHNDEVSLGYNAYSLLETARDKSGQLLPLSVDQFGDFRPAGYFYLVAISEKIFGVNEFAVRFPAAFFGSLLIPSIYFLSWVVFKNKKIAFLSSLTAATLPWLIIVSRSSSESMISFFLAVWGMTFYYLALKNKESKNIWIGTVVFVASFLFYHSARLFVPLFILLFVFSNYRKEIFPHKKTYLISAFLVFLFLLFIVYFSKGGGRVGQVSIFSRPEIKLSLEEQLREDGQGNVLATRVFHNKALNYSLAFVGNFGSYLTSDYLFISGGLPIRYQIPNSGLLLIVDGLFLLLGLTVLLRHKNDSENNNYLPLVILLLGIFPAALTFEETPNIQRAIFSAIGFIFIIAFGQSWLIDQVKKWHKTGTLILWGVGFLYIWNLSYFLHQYFVHQLTHRPWYRDFGVKELVLNLKQKENAYQKIIMTRKNDNNLPFYLFYNHYDPKKYQDLGSPTDKDFLVFGKYEFVPNECPVFVDEKGVLTTKINPQYLYVNVGECRDDPALTTEIIRRPDNTIVFKIISVPRINK